MHASDDTIAKELTKLVDRLSAADPVCGLPMSTEKGRGRIRGLNNAHGLHQSTLSPVDELCLRVVQDYPNDVGCFCVYLLNYVRLAPGESMFMAANEPHAYLSGGVL